MGINWILYLSMITRVKQQLKNAKIYIACNTPLPRWWWNKCSNGIKWQWKGENEWGMMSRRLGRRWYARVVKGLVKGSSSPALMASLWEVTTECPSSWFGGGVGRHRRLLMYTVANLMRSVVLMFITTGMDGDPDGWYVGGGPAGWYASRGPAGWYAGSLGPKCCSGNVWESLLCGRPCPVRTHLRLHRHQRNPAVANANAMNVAPTMWDRFNWTYPRACPFPLAPL